jgi:hypothetical protein
MGFMDSIKEALGGDNDDQAMPPAHVRPLMQARHVDRDAPPERMEDADRITGGKHRLAG